MKSIIFWLGAILLVTYACAWEREPPRRRPRRRPTSPTVTKEGGGIWPQGKLIFEDDFETFNFDVWKHDITLSGGGNGEFQIFNNNRSNSYVKDGKLYIKPTLTADRFGEDFLSHGSIELGGPALADQCTDTTHQGCFKQGSVHDIVHPVYSARIRTAEAFSFTYGHVIVTAKLPRGDWLWPQIWLLPEKNTYGSWPASGEIDLAESRGNVDLWDSDGKHAGVHRVTQALHFGPYPELNSWNDLHYDSFSESGFDQEFTNFSLIWTPRYIKFKVGNDETASLILKPRGSFWSLLEFFKKVGPALDNPYRSSSHSAMAPFDQRFYICLGLSVGGTNGHFSDYFTSKKEKPWSNSSPQAKLDFWKGRSSWLPTWQGENSAFVIDSVRVYAI